MAIYLSASCSNVILDLQFLDCSSIILVECGGSSSGRYSFTIQTSIYKMEILGLYVPGGISLQRHYNSLDVSLEVVVVVVLWFWWFGVDCVHCRLLGLFLFGWQVVSFAVTLRDYSIKPDWTYRLSSE